MGCKSMLTPKSEFRAADHSYWLDGRRMPGITSIIDWMNNYAGVPPDLLEQARDLGEAAHLATELDDTNNLVDESVHPLVQPSLDAWRQFRRDTGFVPVLVEQRVESLKHWYAGRLDRVGPFRKMPPGVVEIKRTAKLMPANGPQTAAQKLALVEMGYQGAMSLARYSVQLCPDKDPPYHMQQHNNPNDITVFLCSIQLWNWRHNNRFKE
jgi:hypothetical protein